MDTLNHEMMHKDHRKRVRNRILNHGFDFLDDYELIEFILFYALPRCDTYAISKNLFNKFHNLSNILSASMDELKEVEGIGENAALLIMSILPLLKLYNKDQALLTKSISKLSDILSLLRSQTFGAKTEEIYCVFLNSGKFSGCIKYSDGNATSVALNIPQLVKDALLRNADSVIIAHNHLNGQIFPSNEDIQSTINIKDALRVVNIKLKDSIIFDQSTYFSIYENNKNIFD